MTSSKQPKHSLTPTCPGQRLVQRTLVDARGRRLPVLRWNEPEGRHVGEQLLGTRLGQLLLVAVPTRTLHKHPVDVAAVLGASTNTFDWLFHRL